MSRTLIRRLIQTTADAILDALTQLQHMRPHLRLDAALLRTQESLRLPAHAVQPTRQRLELDPHTPIGRLRRTELIQLARAIERQSRHTTER